MLPASVHTLPFPPHQSLGFALPSSHSRCIIALLHAGTLFYMKETRVIAGRATVFLSCDQCSRNSTFKSGTHEAELRSDGIDPQLRGLDPEKVRAIFSMIVSNTTEGAMNQSRVSR